MKDYVFSYEVEHDGDKIGIVGKPYTYDDVDDLVRSLVSNYTSTFNKPMFEYNIVDDST